MNDQYEPVIGLEVHIELATRSKMFCRCGADYFGAPPNTHTCSVCLGLPGALPYPNKVAIDYCIKIGLALGCKISERSLFERKNYFYPDLPKGYQISQYRLPLCTGGEIKVEGEDGKLSKIRINRVHQEEDTGKLTHQGGETLIDFNRSGVPLVEIVTEADFTHSAQIKDYAKKLQQIFRYLKVSNADMERGDMRLEANVSVRKKRESGLPNYRVELKNINSFRFMVAAVEYEIKRQIKELEAGNKLHQETRGWNEDKKETFLQRSKEEANDYRYFPEPDLPELRVSREEVERLEKSIPELPSPMINRWISFYKITKEDGQVLSETQDLAFFFEQAVEYAFDKDSGISAKQIANYLINQKIDIIATEPEQVVDDLIAKQGSRIEDEEQIEPLVDEAIKENPSAVKKYQSGKTNALQALMGSVMRKSGGKAHASIVMKLLQRKLK